MGTTVNRAYPYPEFNDLVTDGAAAMQALAEAVDADVEADRVAFAATLNASKSIPNALWTDIDTWSESEDTEAALTSGVFTAPVRGIYVLSANIFWQTNAAGARYLALWRAPAATPAVFAEIPGIGLPANATVDNRQTTTVVLELMAGDKVVPRAFQNSGAALNIAVTAANYLTWGGALLMRTAS